MTKFFKPLWVMFVVAGIVFVGCNKKTTNIVPTPEPAPVVEQAPPPPPPPPPPPVEDLSALLNNLLSPIYFDYDQSVLKSDGISKLESIASFMREHGNVRLMAQGHADERGSSEYNMGLGENRAKSVKSYLTSYGIDSGRLDITTYGKERPARSDCGSDDVCHSGNRRVEWQVLAQ